MDSSNLYKKKNRFGQFLKNFFYDIGSSIKYNPMKIASFFFALQGVLIGFFVAFHYNIINNVHLTEYKYEEVASVSNVYAVSQGSDSISCSVNLNLGDESFKVIFNSTRIFTTEKVDEEASSKLNNYIAGDYSVNKLPEGYDEFRMVLTTENDVTKKDSFIGYIRAHKKALSETDLGEDKTYNFSYTLEKAQMNTNSTFAMQNFEMRFQNGEPINHMPFDFSAISLFALMLVSVLNVFLALTLSKKKNMGSVVIATVSTAILIGLTALYLGTVLTAYNIQDSIHIIDEHKIVWTFETNWAIISVILADIFAVIGVIFGWIFYDRTYENPNKKRKETIGTTTSTKI